MEVSSQLHVLAVLPMGKEPLYLLGRSLGDDIDAVAVRGILPLT
jgi:hypothetical protein